MKIELQRLLLAAAMVGACLASWGEDTTIVVHADKIKGKVEREILGSEVKCASGGEGLMTGLRGAKNDFRTDVMEWVDKLDPAFMRYKFMRGAWNWEDGIGPLANRKDDSSRQKFMGIDEVMAFQMKVVKDAAKCQLVVNPRDPQQCAALVAYLNVPADDPAKNRHDQVISVSKANDRDYKTIGYWAKLRAENGHPKPYGVKWFELGNESYQEFPNKDPHAYCLIAKESAKAMKAVDPSVCCGVNTEAYPTKQQQWRPILFKEGCDFPDFIVCHAYYPFAYPRNNKFTSSVSNMDKVKVEELYYKMIMAGAHQGLSDWRWFRAALKSAVPRAEEIMLCLTENGFSLEIEDAKAQNTVLVGVYDVDLIGMMVEYADELKLKNGNLYLLQGDNSWALINHQFEHADAGRIIPRPPYYALYMWTHYFGSSLLQSDVKCGTFDIPLAKGDDWPPEKNLWTQIAAQDGIPFVTAHSSLSSDGKTLYMIVVNRDLYNDIDSVVELKNFSPQAAAEVHTLNTSVTSASKKTEDMFAVWDSNNEDSNDVVKIRDTKINNAGPSFRFTFPAHSATAIVLKAK